MIMHQQIGQPRKNGQILRNIQSSKTESEGKRNSEQTTYWYWNWVYIQFVD